MAVKRQKRKHILTVYRPIVTVDRLNVSFRIERNQSVKAFLFLILKSTRLDPPTERAQNAGDGGGYSRGLSEPAILWITLRKQRNLAYFN